MRERESKSERESKCERENISEREREKEVRVEMSRRGTADSDKAHLQARWLSENTTPSMRKRNPAPQHTDLSDETIRIIVQRPRPRHATHFIH